MLSRGGVIACAAFILWSAAASASPACHETPGYYVNSDGQVVHRPECVTTHQPGETAICNDGSHSFSRHHTARIMAA